jgi:polyvinyl alcohol dehydrogenase (cytochrome)
MRKLLSSPIHLLATLTLFLLTTSITVYLDAQVLDASSSDSISPGLRAELVKQFAPPDWFSAGQNLGNTRSQFLEFTVGPGNVKNLQPKWTFTLPPTGSTTAYQLSATPTVGVDAIYFPDLNSKLYAVSKNSSALIWSHAVSDYTGVIGSNSRVSPAIAGTQLFIGDRSANGADIISVNSATGALTWITRVETHPAAQITGSPIVYNGVVYVGIASGEEGSAENLKYACCTFRGSVVALDATTGKIIWKTYTVPDNGGKPGGYAGASVWSPPAIDTFRNAIYVGTANNYSMPASVVACQIADPTKLCAASDDYFDSVLALDLKTGSIKWGTHLRTYDDWTLACIRDAAPNANCPLPSSVDSGSGSGPNFMLGIVGVGQKDGTYWALNADNGQPVWKTQVGPGGSSGGIQWGTATDGYRIYVASANSNNLPYTLEPSGEVITGGAWSALDLATGKILWQTADPTQNAVDIGAVSVAHGVMYTGSPSGEMYALDTVTGNILWSYQSGGEVIDGPSIVDGTLYWGSGYGGSPNNKVYAFSLKESQQLRK